MSLKELRKKWRNWRRIKIKSKVKADLQANHIVNLPKNCIVRLEIHGKNSAIPPHSIVGWCSNVMSEFAEPHVVIAGNPAKIVKRNISWSRERYNQAAARYAEAHAAPALKR